MPLTHPAITLVRMRDMVRSFIVAVWPTGGQGTARRNAWSAMVEDSQRARERAAVEVSVRAAAVAAETASHPVAVNG
ncbi:MAG TPA: hypothetical protein VHX15_05230 [Frankiaceae bacterium]|jgi:hypothetical protein|nr:hypothetical protein [Frankiaceae bacterium]